MTIMNLEKKDLLPEIKVRKKDFQFTMSTKKKMIFYLIRRNLKVAVNKQLTIIIENQVVPAMT